MGEEFYSVLKLVSGEELFSLVSVDDNDGDPLIILQNPVVMKTGSNNGNAYIKIKPWMEIPNDDIFIIKLDKVITMTEVKDENTIELYERYLNDDHHDFEIDGKVKISDKMGFISTVEDARKKLEKIFKGIKESQILIFNGSKAILPIFLKLVKLIKYAIINITKIYLQKPMGYVKKEIRTLCKQQRVT